MKIVKSTKMPKCKIIMVGNPNVGKSVFFGKFIGKYAVVSNYSGIMVEISCGKFMYKGCEYELIDMFGVNSLFVRSEDEKVMCDVLLLEESDLVVFIIDSKNVSRGFSFFAEFVHIRKPVIICLNMYDEAIAVGIEIDIEVLKEFIFVRFIKTTFTEGMGISELLNAISSFDKVKLFEISAFSDACFAKQENLIRTIFSSDLKNSGLLIRFLMLGDFKAVRLYEHGLVSTAAIMDGAVKIYMEFREKYGQEMFEAIHEITIRELADLISCVVYEELRSTDGRSLLDRITTHSLFGSLFVLFAIYIFYIFVGRFSSS